MFIFKHNMLLYVSCIILIEFKLISGNIVYYRSIGDPELEEIFEEAVQDTDDEFDWMSSADEPFDLEGILLLIL